VVVLDQVTELDAFELLQRQRLGRALEQHIRHAILERLDLERLRLRHDHSAETRHHAQGRVRAEGPARDHAVGAVIDEGDLGLAVPEHERPTRSHGNPAHDHVAAGGEFGAAPGHDHVLRLSQVARWLHRDAHRLEPLERHRRDAAASENHVEALDHPHRAGEHARRRCTDQADRDPGEPSTAAARGELETLDRNPAEHAREVRPRGLERPRVAIVDRAADERLRAQRLRSELGVDRHDDAAKRRARRRQRTPFTQHAHQADHTRHEHQRDRSEPCARGADAAEVRRGDPGCEHKSK
jgi:hypothetical protein